jgi:hypothetical protein
VFGVSDSGDTQGQEPSGKRKHGNWLKALWRRLFAPDSNWQPTQEIERNPVGIPEETMTTKNKIVNNSPIPWHSIQTDAGSILIFCDEHCLNSYTINVLAEDEHYGEVTKALQNECVYCYWCSIRINQPENCFVHGSHCPVISWKYTHQAVECHSELTLLFYNTGQSIPAEILDDVEDLAEMYGPDIPGRAIARIAYKGWEFFQ